MRSFQVGLLTVLTGWACCAVGRAQNAPAPPTSPFDVLQVAPFNPTPASPLGPPDPPTVFVQPPPALPTVFVQPPPFPPPPPRSKLWCGGVELGLSGTDGNSQNANFRIGANAKYKTEDNILITDLLYRYAANGSLTTENRARANVRDENLFLGTPWSAFADGTLEYDEFSAFDVRLASHVGGGALFLKTVGGLLKGRAGVGVSKDFGSDNRWNPEGVLALDFEQKVTERGKFTADAEYFPSFANLGTYRLVSKVGYEWLIDPEWNVTLKVGALDRYDTATTAKNPKYNDIEYFMTLFWKF